jgi:hypothetical protein
LCTAWRSTDHVQDIARNKRTRGICCPARGWRHVRQVRAQMRVGKQSQYAGHYDNEVARTHGGGACSAFFVCLKRCQSLFLCVCKHLFCYIYVLCVHVQMDPATAFWQPHPHVPTPFLAPQYPTSKVVWLKNTGEAPSFRPSNGDLCDLCQAQGNAQPQMFPPMSLPGIPPPWAQSVDGVHCLPSIAPGQRVPLAPNPCPTTPVQDNVVYVVGDHPQNNTAPSMQMCIAVPPHSSDSSSPFHPNVIKSRGLFGFGTPATYLRVPNSAMKTQP